MENISLLKEKWFKKEVERLSKEGVSKADISRALGIKPQYLNSVLNGSRGLADTFLDKFIEVYSINQFDLSQSLTDSNISAMSLRLMEKLDEKDAQIDKLHIELRLIEKELAETKARLSHYEPKTEEAKEHPKGLGTAKDASTKKPSSPNADNAASATAQ